LAGPAPQEIASAFKTRPVRVIRTPLSAFQREILKGLGQSRRPDLSTRLADVLEEKVLCVGPAVLGLDQTSLDSGRLPEPGSDEVLAGFMTRERREFTVGAPPGRRLQVVGVLRRDLALLGNSYVLGSDWSEKPSPDGQTMTLIALDAKQLSDRAVIKKIRDAVPGVEFAYTPPARVGRGPFYLYMAGLAVLLVAGSGAFIGLFRLLARRVRWRRLREPLLVLRRWKRLVWAVHLGFFGLIILSGLVIYEFPAAHVMLMSMTHSLFSGGGPLGVVGEAYRSGNVWRAAGLTFAANFLWATVVTVTLPSLVLGFGVVVSVVRAVFAGAVLAPAWVAMARGMLPHSWTVLLECEAYILATIFGLMIPIYLFRSRLGGRWHQRFGLAVRVNLEGWLLCAALLLVAALYEAVEVIAMSR
jgi:hypothetical protein